MMASDWADIIQQMAERHVAEEEAYCNRLEAEMPQAIAKLPDHTPELLFDLYDQFSGGRNNPRETVLREQFRNAIKAEFLRRMKPAKPSHPT